jgi:Cft2 family RNA processing exonuclease
MYADPRQMSFAAHVDFSHNYDFISRVRPANIVLVHGEKKTVEQLRGELVRRTMEWPQGVCGYRGAVLNCV